MGVEEHRSRAPRTVKVAVITVSDTRTAQDDFSGNAIQAILKEGGHEVVRRIIVRDEAPEIQQVLREIQEDERIEAVVINGGTGVARRDVTLEAVTSFQEKVLPGFGELFRMLSFKEIGSAAMLSRATAFVSEGKVIFCLPGSEKAVKLATKELIAPELGHMVWEARR